MRRSSRRKLIHGGEMKQEWDELEDTRKQEAERERKAQETQKQSIDIDIFKKHLIKEMKAKQKKEWFGNEYEWKSYRWDDGDFI